jgi:hypothetical protein
MRSQSLVPTDVENYWTHGLVQTPDWVSVTVRLPSSLSINPGFVFYGMSHQVRDDDGTPGYGGLLYAYTSATVRVFAPNRVRALVSICRD